MGRRLRPVFWGTLDSLGDARHGAIGSDIALAGLCGLVGRPCSQAGGAPEVPDDTADLARRRGGGVTGTGVRGGAGPGCANADRCASGRNG
jgi:hypothetical protein